MWCKIICTNNQRATPMHPKTAVFKYMGLTMLSGQSYIKQWNKWPPVLFIAISKKPQNATWTILNKCTLYNWKLNLDIIMGTEQFTVYKTRNHNTTVWHFTLPSAPQEYNLPPGNIPRSVTPPSVCRKSLDLAWRPGYEASSSNELLSRTCEGCTCETTHIIIYM